MMFIFDLILNIKMIQLIKKSEFTVKAMFYTKNKDCVKKSIAKVEHKGAHKHIINMVKQMIGRDNQLASTPSYPSQMAQNRPANNQINSSDSKITISNFLKQPSKQPIMCESVYSSGQKRKRYLDRLLTIEKVIDYSIHNTGESTKAAKAQKQYTLLLEQKINKLEGQLQECHTNITKIKKQYEQKYRVMQSQCEMQKLLRFYHRARNILVLQSVQLLESMNIISQLKPAEPRLKSINCMMAKTEQLLEVYRRSMQKGSPRKPRQQNNRKMQMQQLKQQCEYQQKTIEFLRKQTPPTCQFNQIRLLRHEINRVCSQNEKLLQKLSKVPKNNSPTKQKQQNKQILMKQKQYVLEIQEMKNYIDRLKQQNQKLKYQLEQEKDYTFRLREEKECLGSFLEQAKIRTEELEINMENYQKQICQLKLSQVNCGGQLRLKNKDIATTQQLCRQLKAYPRYFNLLMSIITQYQSKISLLQDKICYQRQQKQKFIQWSSQIYNLLSKSSLPQQTIQKHMNELYKLDTKIQNSKIQKYLRQIRALSIGIDQKQIGQMEIQLDDYIVSLKCRNQVIKEVQYQDGSSVGGELGIDRYQFE